MGRLGLRFVALGYLVVILVGPLFMMVWRTAEDLDGAWDTMRTLAETGISLKATTDALLTEGIQLFVDAFRKLLAGAEFLALARNRSFKDEDGELSLDTGAFVAALEYAARREAIVLGKPAPAFFQAALASTEIDGKEAVMVFYQRHLCRIDPWPDWLVECFAILEANPEVYRSMNGPSEFHVIGTIKDWDITDRLGRIEAPTLVFSGRYDEVTPATTEAVHRGIPGSEYVVLEASSHMAQAEEPEQTLELVRDFLARCELRLQS